MAHNITVHPADYMDFGIGTNDDGKEFFVVGIYKEIPGGTISEMYSFPLEELLESGDLIRDLANQAREKGILK